MIDIKDIDFTKNTVHASFGISDERSAEFEISFNEKLGQFYELPSNERSGQMLFKLLMEIPKTTAEQIVIAYHFGRYLEEKDKSDLERMVVLLNT